MGSAEWIPLGWPWGHRPRGGEPPDVHPSTPSPFDGVAGDDGDDAPWVDTFRTETGGRWRSKQSLCRALVAESEAYLEGRLVEHLERQALPVPAWAWTNVLAHGSAEEIGQAAHGVRTPWYAARAYAATEVLAMLTRGVSLPDLQHDALVTLELELSRRSDLRAWSPQRWVAAVRAALSAYRHAHRL